MDKLTQAREALTEREIEELRMKAFVTNAPADFDVYFLACSKWFQDRHYRALSDGEAVEPVAWRSATKPPEKDGFYLVWQETPPQSHPLQAARFRAGEWLSSWKVLFWRPMISSPFDPASPPDQSDAALRERVAELEAENLRLREGCPIEAPCGRLVRMAKAHTDASKRARTAEARATEGGQNDER